jgi:hypothetical protein
MIPDGREGLQMFRLSVNKLNKHPWAAANICPPTGNAIKNRYYYVSRRQ